GVDGIKLFLPVPEGVLAAAVNEAHRAGKPVFVHPSTTADVMNAIGAGVDVIAHTTPHSESWTRSGLALTPTLSLWKSYARHDRISMQDRVVNASIAQLRTWRDSGGQVLFGTDLGAVDPDPGEEYALMAQAGMTITDILASLTTTPTARFGDATASAASPPGIKPISRCGRRSPMCGTHCAAGK
ncbi:MAG TPA: hypothetical protein VN181_02605, partial [Thermoanaerobaculia bacterium]|nr:hypothetical protein [Thermoanaerobaculia bacterium]